MGEGGGKDRANKEKELFVEIFFWKKWPLSSRGEGYGLNGLAISGGTFFAASLNYSKGRLIKLRLGRLAKVPLSSSVSKRYNHDEGFNHFKRTHS